MKCICADSVTLGREAFAGLGELILLPETEISPESLGDAEAIITRSKTGLTPDLLSGSRIRFAGTCTAGTDHVDASGLLGLGIHAASAPGCNANAVSEYVVAALLEFAMSSGFRFEGTTVGIVGHGQVGTRVDRKLTVLGCRVLRNDPPREAAGDPGPYVSLEEVLNESDVLTLHVPLVEEGPWPTRDLISKEQLHLLKPGAILINACRGEVLDAVTAADLRRDGALAGLVLDVWDPEPQLPEAVLAVADIGSPHIAGHSLEGKVNGTIQIREALVDFFKLQVPAWDAEPLLRPPENLEVALPTVGGFEERLQVAVKACYDICSDDSLLREGEGSPGSRFNHLRRNYRNRREFTATCVHGVPEAEREVYAALGFQLKG